MDSLPLGEGFGERMRQERKRLGLTQETLAHRVGVRQQTILQYEKGSTSPSVQFLYALHGIGFNLQYLLLGKAQTMRSSDYPPEVIRYAANAVSQIEEKFAGGTLSNEARLRMMLILLEQYVEQPATLPVSDAQASELLAGS